MRDEEAVLTEPLGDPVLAESMETELVPIRSRAESLRANPSLLDDALATAAAKCRSIANETLGEVRARMGFD